MIVRFLRDETYGTQLVPRVAAFDVLIYVRCSDSVEVKRDDGEILAVSLDDLSFTPMAAVQLHIERTRWSQAREIAVLETLLKSEGYAWPRK